MLLDAAAERDPRKLRVAQHSNFVLSQQLQNRILADRWEDGRRMLGIRILPIDPNHKE